MSYYNRNETVSIGSWIITYILLIIPIVNIIYVIVLLCGGGNKNKVNLVRAALILILIPIIIGILLTIFGGINIQEIFKQTVSWIQNTINKFVGK